MKIIGFLTVIVFAIYAAWRVIKRKSIGIPLLKCTVATRDGMEYAVNYQTLHPGTKPVEYVRLILMFGAKMLYNITPNDPQQRTAFLEAFETLGKTGLENTTDVIRLLRIPIKASESTCPQESSQISAVLGYKNVAQRSIWTVYPGRTLQLQAFHSWVAVLQMALPKLDRPLLKTLQSSLAFMGKEYSVGATDGSSIAALVEMPNQAFNYAFQHPPTTPN